METRRIQAELSYHMVLILGGAFFALASTATANDHLSINCGSSTPFMDSNGREWLGDFRSKVFRLEGMSTTMRFKHDLDLVPYSTARASRSQFSYRIRLNPGEKFIRLHFGKGLEYFTDFFNVEAGPFTLLHNFSASITARALALDAVVKEFCLTVEENQPLDIIFIPTQTPSLEAYAFVNGIEILSLPSGLSYCQGGANGVQIVGQKDVVSIDRGVALEIVRRVDMKLDSDPNLVGDVGSIARIWERNLKQKGEIKIEKNMTWNTSVDVGFRYMVRVQYREIGIRMVEIAGRDFSVIIDGVIVSTAKDLLKSREEEGFLWQKNYMVALSGRKQEGKRDIVVSFHSEYGVTDENGLFEGFEIFKISNFDNSLAGRNPNLPELPNSGSFNGMHALFLLLWHNNGFSNALIIVICMVNMIVHLLRKIIGVELAEVGEIKPSARAKKLCRLFSLGEIKSATENFHDQFLIGRGGFGKVYKGTIDNGRETAAIKRLKPNSKQGKREFWTEIEALSELRHLNLVSLIGYCKERCEMILVYEYVPSGSLADHLYKSSKKNQEAPSSLSWTQRLDICIGAARGVDYLHTGHGIIHRDIKSSNILLDEKLVAKVSDFGLAKWESGKVLQSRVSTHVKGSPGYLDPNYIITHKFTSKSDTYSFGVVLLEVLCGRPAVEPFASEDKRSLTVWARNKMGKGEVDLIIDPCIKKEIAPDSLATFLAITEKCLHDEPRKRPTVAYVIINLELALEQQERSNSLMPNEISRVADFLPHTAPMTKVYNVQSLSSQEQNNQILSGSAKHGRKTVMRKLARFFPFNAGRKNIESPKRDYTAPLSAPIARKTKKVGKAKLNSTPDYQVFSFSQLQAATKNFSTILGKGGFGVVYKGWFQNSDGGIQNHYPIAVKRLSSDSMQGIEQWQSEVIFLAKISHPNLVKLLGYCCEDKKLLLVYEFMELGSLDVHLFNKGPTARPVLPWDTRLLILIGIAQGLAYLHSIQIIWRDVKTSNILLHGMFSPKVSDFGLAKSGPDDDRSHVTTQVMGTHGYAAPEYVMSGHLTTKCDVYGFGVVMLEMLTGLRVNDANRPRGERNLVHWMRPLLHKKGELNNIMDRSLNGNYTPKAAFQAANLTRRCLNFEPLPRPSMEDVLKSLEQIRSNSDREQFE